jgi:parallel beta-helix repeat protein
MKKRINIQPYLSIFQSAGITMTYYLWQIVIEDFSTNLLADLEQIAIGKRGENMNRAISVMILTLLLTSMVQLAFNTGPVKSDYAWTETIYIRADGSIHPADAPISTADYVTYTLTDNIVGDVPQYSSAIIIEKDDIIIDGAGYTLQGSKAFSSFGMELVGRSNVTIKNMRITAFGVGIRLYSSSGNTVGRNNITNNEDGGIYLDYYSNNDNIRGNNITNNAYGIALGHVSNSTISENNITNNRYGIGLSSSSGNSIDGNNIETNYWHGICLGNSSENTINGNNVADSGWGIYLLYWSSGNIMGGNNITNTGQGIRLEYYSSNNTIAGNNITNNNCGIYFSQFSGNKFHHNNFNNNIDQVYSTENVNVWDDGYPSGGNYWSDYSGVDVRSGPNQDQPEGDGIGDTPYIIDADNQDYYPLMKPWTLPVPKGLGDVNGDGKVDIYDIVQACTSYGSKLGEPNWNPNANYAPPWNEIDIYDLVTITSHYGKTYP